MQNYWHKRQIYGTYIGCRLVLRNAQHVLDIRLNLVSTGKINDKGFHNSQGEGKWKLSKGNLIIVNLVLTTFIGITK